VCGTECRPISDIRASRDYRCSMVEVLTKRALLEAVTRIKEGGGR
jgi:CO/xanthine dehydrogenase FAD-binding subunit